MAYFGIWDAKHYTIYSSWPLEETGRALETLLDWSRGKKRTTYRGGTEKSGIQRGWVQRTAYSESPHRSTPGQSDQPASSMSPWCEGTSRHQILLFDSVTVSVVINRDGFMLPPIGGKHLKHPHNNYTPEIWSRFGAYYEPGISLSRITRYTWPIDISMHMAYAQYL